MKTIELNLYTASELKAQFPDAWETALNRWQNNQTEIFWQDEIIESLKAVFRPAGVRLQNWPIGGRGTNCRAEFRQEESGELTGKRAFAWLENNLFAHLRIPWRGEKRWKVAQYGKLYRPGLIKPCPLTGYCADEDFLDSLRSEIKSGSTLKEAFENLACVAAKLIEQEAESQASEEYFLDYAEANGFQFTEDGEIY